MSQSEIKSKFEKVLKNLEAKGYPDEKARVHKLLDEALDHAELVITEYDSQRKDAAQKKRQDEANAKANEDAKKAAAEKAKNPPKKK